VLAELPCNQVNPCRTTVLMRETVNGGRTWYGARSAGAGVCAYRGYTASLGAGAWRPLPGTATTGASGSLPSVQLAVSGSAGYRLAISRGAGTPVLLSGPVTGTGHLPRCTNPRIATDSHGSGFRQLPGVMMPDS
jgi:hypothetical protein